VTTVPVRTYDDLQAAPALATLPALSACIEAFVAALDVAHPYLRSSSRPLPICERETTALLIHMHLDACQHLLHLYDQLTFDGTYWYCPEDDEQHEDEPNHDPEDDIPF
jgi:hypothetical protein